MSKAAYTVKSAALAVERSEKTIRAAIHADGSNPELPPLKAKRDGKGYLIKATDLDAWLDALPDA